MLRALFFREYRKALIAHVGILGTLVGLLIVFEHLAPRLGLGKATNSVVLDVILLGALVVSGFISGERCFSASFKEGRYHFLTALPLSKVHLWVSLCLPRLLGA